MTKSETLRKDAGKPPVEKANHDQVDDKGKLVKVKEPKGKDDKE